MTLPGGGEARAGSADGDVPCVLIFDRPEQALARSRGAAPGQLVTSRLLTASQEPLEIDGRVLRIAPARV